MKPWVKSVGLVFVWVALFAIFSALMPETFATPRNIETIMRQTVIAALAAVGMTFIIITGQIDLSVGSLVALTTVIVAKALNAGVPPWAAALLGVAAGGIAGLINGTLSLQLRVGSFIVTLATLLAFRGLAKGLAQQNTVPTPLNPLMNLTSALPADRKWILLPVGAWMAIVVAVLAAVVMNRTVFGRHVIAIGSNAATARMCGVRVERTMFLVFLLAGLCFGLAGVMQYSRLTVGDPTVAAGLELSVIAAVVIGGASLSGGEGSIFGAFAGALIMATIATGTQQLGWPNWVQEIVTGAIILAAVGLDRWRLSRAEVRAG